ncbi:hypothetical protein F4561_004116 [Lipingzhangella halophila]|uniref:Uncharacterized protein n=1 Tax=Lipingzhangella halophila TaxID=1783352 RepID=A0A7W7RKQ3_9ACTN|nr:hypothetical protein [Lipingzhangella halophila]MBB4933296.1 hypothetical protein [Lipingzhangella halophila]
MSAPPAVLVVDTASPALFTATAADSGVHTGIVTDAHGLPYLPRHRIAARLREGAVRAVRSEPGTNLGTAARDLLGTTNGGHEEHRLLRIGHARLAHPVRAAVAWAMAQRSASHQREALARAVTDTYTTEESGTEVDAHGAPVPGRLRTNQALRPRLRLVAELGWAAPPDAALLRCLARTALATTAAGLRVTRGRGRIDVRLADPAGERDPHDYTVALAELDGPEGGRA